MVLLFELLWEQHILQSKSTPELAMEKGDRLPVFLCARLSMRSLATCHADLLDLPKDTIPSRNHQGDEQKRVFMLLLLSVRSDVFCFFVLLCETFFLRFWETIVSILMAGRPA